MCPDQPWDEYNWPVRMHAVSSPAIGSLVGGSMDGVAVGFEPETDIARRGG